MNTQFLPNDYKSPSSNGRYMKLQNGENKIRILTSPILGWEDWIDSKPVRYRMDEKPKAWQNPELPGRHFWGMVVWNCLEEKIQVLHLTQGSIRKAIETLSKDSDWGAPYTYDVKITKTGEGLKTKYNVTPLPKKPVSRLIEDSFEQTPCYLEALFDGQDPFGDYENRTPGFFTSFAAISIEQIEELGEMIGDDEQLREDMLKWADVAVYAQITQDKFETIVNAIAKRKHNEDKNKLAVA